MSFKQLKYYPELNEITGSVNATLTLLQLEYWFAKCKGNKFYKFLDKCEHERYKEGDSWVEELRFTKHEFRSAFAKIGKAYKSKKAFDESKDVFEGRYYASYYDRIKGLTYYIRNHEALDQLFGKQDDLGNKPVEICGDSKNEYPISVDNNKLLTSEKDTDITEDVPYETIKELFNACCASFPKVTVLTDKRKTLLKKLWQDMGQTLECFKKVFDLAESSDFLSGRKGSWRASFDWLLQESKFIAVLEGSYANYKNQGEPAKAQPKNKFLDMYTRNWDFEALEKLENEYISEQLQKLQVSAAVI